MLYWAQLPSLDQREQEESTREPNISSPGMKANKAMKTSWVVIEIVLVIMESLLLLLL